MPAKNQKKTSEKKSGSKVRWVIFIILIIAAGIFSYLYLNKGGGVKEANVAIDSLIEGEAFVGNENAPLVIVEFSDFQCPFCRTFWTDTLPYLKTNYIDTEKVMFVYKDFPLVNIHPMALPTSEVATCVFDQYGSDAFWKFHDEIYAQQNLLDSGERTGQVTKTVAYNIDDLKDWADGIGYDVTSCIESRDDYLNETSQDFQEGVTLNVTGTPTFLFANRETGNVGILPGAYPWDDFQKAIEQISS